MAYQKKTDNYDKNDNSGKKADNSSFAIKALSVLFIAVAAFAVFYFYNDKPEDSSGTKKKKKSEVIRESKAATLDAATVDEITEVAPTVEFTPPVIEEDTDSSNPFVTVEQMPRFPGGEAAMHKFIGDNLKYPVSAQDAGIQGRVTVRFVVSKTGKVSDVKIIRGIDPACDKEVVRIIKAMPNWIPGEQHGIAVPVYFTIPVVFRLNS
ncbi:energy transducer TonB [uncultured Dysgonomonas sp.]|uniref:TonB C-terminal domain-containing protein n=1 Tax=uncultured Dysgonomonas sp. TaxID=206096 RepID=A0A212JUX5_9BACT|nr:energy transducer TonB [uncultured Dysgonomonas sp.]SBW03251.1 conserved hypothetical protein [uncultured Dysgonomonas sp.]